jgi:HEAT repeat protein
MKSSLSLLALVLGAGLANDVVARQKRADDKQETPALTDRERRQIQARADELAGKGADGIAALARDVREGKEEAQLAALRALRSLGADAAPAVDSVLPLLKGTDLKRKMLAIDVLRAVGPAAKSAVPALIETGKETQDLDGSFHLDGPSNVAEASIEAVRAIDAAALPRLAEAVIPGLLDLMRKGRAESSFSAMTVLRKLGPHAKPALPRLKELLPEVRAYTPGDVVSIFRAAGDDGEAMLADLMLDPKTTSELRVRLLDGFRWEKETTPATIRILRALLHDKAAKVRAAAVAPLQRVRAPELIPDLIELLGDLELLKVVPTYQGDEYRVARALGRQGKEAVPALVKALENKTPLARFQAARALSHLGKDARDAIPALEALFKDPMPIIQIESAKAVLKLGKDSDAAREKLGQYLDPDSRSVSLALDAVQDLGLAGRFSFPAVKRIALESADFHVQRASLDALKGMGAEPREVVQVWTKLIKKNKEFLTFRPREAIRLHPKEVQDSFPLLYEYLTDRDVNVRARVTEILAEMGPAATAAVPALIKALEDDSFVAHDATRALGAIGPAARPAVVPLLKRWDNIKPGEREADYHRETILKTLASIGPGAVEAVPRLVEWLPDHPLAARALGAVGPEAKVAVGALEKMYRDETGAARLWAAFALVKITGKTAPYVAHLAELLDRSKDLDQRYQVVEVLIELGPDARAALPALLRAIKFRDVSQDLTHGFRHDVARALVHFGPDARAAVPELIDMVKNSYAARITAVEVLGAIGPDAKEAIPALLQIAEDPSYRTVVEKALARIRAK